AEAAQWLVGLAALTGRTGRFITLRHAQRDLVLEGLAGLGSMPPASVVDAEAALNAYAAHGAPVESVAVAAARAERLAAPWAGADATRLSVVDALFSEPLLLAAPTIGRRAFWRRPPPGATLSALEYARVTHDTVAATGAAS